MPQLFRKSIVTRLLLAAVLIVTAAPVVPAQSVSVAYGPCAPGQSCTIARFTIVADASSDLFLNELTLDAAPGTNMFASSSSISGKDELGEFPMFGNVLDGGMRLFLDFLTELQGPFTLLAGNSGFIDVSLAEQATPAPLSFMYTGTLASGAPITGTVNDLSTVPEPGTVVLLATGLAGLGLIARRRSRS